MAKSSVAGGRGARFAQQRPDISVNAVRQLLIQANLVEEWKSWRDCARSGARSPDRVIGEQ
jgi:hypothetical protein